jgi:hypothetical protein
MSFYWLRDRIEEKEFDVYWQPGTSNRADYFTKHHHPDIHSSLRTTYYEGNTPYIDTMTKLPKTSTVY